MGFARIARARIKWLLLRPQGSRRKHSRVNDGEGQRNYAERSALSGPVSLLMPWTLSIDRDLLDRRALSAFTVFLG